MANSSDTSPGLDLHEKDQDVLLERESLGPNTARVHLMGSEVWLKSVPGVRSAPSLAPPLASNLFVKVCTLRKRATDVAPGWGLVLRGTTSELASGRKVYTCYVEDVHHGSEAQVKS